MLPDYIQKEGKNVTFFTPVEEPPFLDEPEVSSPLQSSSIQE